MNDTLKIAAVAAGSFIAGYFVSNWRNEKFYMNQAQQEINHTREDLEKIREQGRESNRRVDEEIQSASLVLQAKADEALSSYQGDGGFVPVDIHAVDAPPMIQYSDYITPEEPEAKSETKATVEVLTSTEYADNPVDYEDSTLIYYAQDDVLVGGRIGEGRVGETLRAQMLGDKSDILKRPEFWEKDEVWYFRNHALKYVFEIMREDGVYEDEESSGGDG